MKRFLLIPVIFLLISNLLHSQVVDGVLNCKEETFRLLKEISGSVCSKGEILLSITTHQDLGWVDEVEKCIILRDTLWLTPYLKRLKEDPGFRMDIEQTSIIVEYIKRHPEKKAEIQKGLDDGKILIGATYTQPYEEMFSGESLIRQLYLGKKWLASNFKGYESDTYYNSDVPGRTLQMSQILSKSGVHNMFVSRHEKGVYNWYSPDNSKVTMFSSGHYIDFYNILGLESEPGIARMASEVLFWGSYYDMNSKDVIIPALLNYEFIWDQKPVKNCDPFINMWNSISYIRNEKGEKEKVTLPHFKYGNLNTCLNAIRENSKKIRDISGDRPELWLYIHGPSHHFAVTASREADILLPDAEKFSAINSLLEGNFRNYDEQKFSEAWEAKIYPDHGWGGKGGEITDRLFLSKFVKSRTDASALLDGSLQRIASKVDFKGKGIPLVVFNGLNWKRDDPVSFSLSFSKGEAHGIKLSDCQKYPVDNQLSGLEYFDDGSIKTCTVSFIASDVPSVGYTTFYAEASNDQVKNIQSAFNADYENQFYSVRFGKGGIEKLFDKKLGRDIIDASKFRLGEVFTMQSVGNGAGEFTDVQQPSMEGYDKTGNYETAWEKIADGPVFTSFRYRQPVRYAVVEETIIIYKQIKKIDFEIDIKNWQGILYREFRAAFPLNMSSPEITYEVPMGVVTVGKDELKGPAGNMYKTDCRLIHPRTLIDWVNASGKDFGATISSSVIAFDYLDPTTNPTSNTMIQPILFASRKSCHWEGNDYIQLGDHHFSFSLFTHEPGWQNGFHEGKQAQNKLYPVIDPVKAQNKLIPEKQSFLSINGDLLLLTALKKSEDDNTLTMRIVEMGGADKNFDLKFFTPIQNIIKTNLIEENGLNTGLHGDVVKMKIGKNAIETYKLDTEKKLTGHRFLTFNTVIRVNQIEVSRDKNAGFDERDLHTPSRVIGFRKAIEDGFPGARITWAFSWLALHDTTADYKKIRELVVGYHYRYGDEITFIPGAYFANAYNSEDQVNSDLHEGLEKVTEITGNGYRPISIVAGFLSAKNMEYLAKEEAIHVCQGNVWSQYAIDNQDGEGSVCYPYYPSKEHFCKPAQDEHDFIDCVNLDGWTLDFLAARREGFSDGFNSRMGVGPIETLGKYSQEVGLKEMLHTTAIHFDRGFELNGFAWVTSCWELSLPIDISGLTKWLSEIKKQWPDTEFVTQGEFGLIWREHYKNNNFNYRFEETGSGIGGSDEGLKIRWLMNKTFRLALLSDIRKGKEDVVIDFTRYDLKAKEPVSGSTRNWSLMGDINQKQVRPQDKPVALKFLDPEKKSIIRKYYPELKGL
jgi:alpha-mannosidase